MGGSHEGLPSRKVGHGTLVIVRRLLRRMGLPWAIGVDGFMNGWMDGRMDDSHWRLVVIDCLVRDSSAMASLLHDKSLLKPFS